MQGKVCKNCGDIKEFGCFYRHPLSKDGLQYSCKQCIDARRKTYSRNWRTENNRKKCKKLHHSFKGYARALFRNVLSRTKHSDWYKKRIVTFSRDQLFLWLVKNEAFIAHYIKWKVGGYQHRLAPSLDRIDNNRGYDLDNIQIITMAENASKGNRSHYREINYRECSNLSGVRYCTICGELKRATLFPFRKQFNRYDSWCKECYRIKKRISYYNKQQQILMQRAKNLRRESGSQPNDA